MPAPRDQGRFVPGSSPVHRLDPRVKLVTCVLAAAAAFASVAPWGLAGTWAVLVFSAGAARLPARLALRAFGRSGWLLAATMLVHALGGGEGLGLPLAGLGRGAMAVARVGAGIGFSALLVVTTSPADLVWALERLLRPLRRVGFPVDDFSGAMAVAVRCVPLLREELEVFGRAARDGGDGLRSRLRAAASLLPALGCSLLDRADGLERCPELRAPAGGREARPLGRPEAAAVGLALLCLGATAVAPRLL